MDQIDRDIAELDARIAEFRATPHKELQMTEYELVEPRVTVTLDPEHHRLIEAIRRENDRFISRAEIVRGGLTLGLPELLDAMRKVKMGAKP
jgi:hypothetical protein